MNQLDLERLVDLRAQPLDRDIDHVRVAVEIHVPHFGGDQRARQRLALALDQQLQQQEFLVCQHDLDALASDLAAQYIELEVGDLEHVTFADHAPAQQRANPQHEFGEGKRLDEIVVGAEFQAANAVADVVARGQENDRQIAPRPQRTHDFPAVDARQHHVQHHEVVRVFERHVQAVRAGAREVDRVAAFAQPLLQVVAGFRVVFDDEDAHDAWIPTPCAASRVGHECGRGYDGHSTWPRRTVHDVFVIRLSLAGATRAPNLPLSFTHPELTHEDCFR